MRRMALLLCGALVGYAVGHAGRVQSVARAERGRAVATHEVMPVVSPERCTAARDPTSDEAWNQMVEATPCPTPLEGTGRIRGFVRDAAGQPLAGAAVNAVPDELPGSANDLGSRTRQFVSRRKWQALSERRAVTDVNGFYEVDGVGDALYTLTAWARGSSIDRRSNVHPGAVADFSLSPVVELRVRILLPDGSMAPFARLHLRQPGTYLSGPWRPGDDSRDVKPGVWVLNATHPVLETLGSARVEVDAKWGEAVEPVVLRLEERPGIRGRLLLSSGDVPRAASLYLLPCRDSSPPEPSAFRSADLNDGCRSDLDGATFGLFDLNPGAYWIAAAVPDGDVESCTRVDVGAGISEVQLEISGNRMPDPEPSIDVLDDVTDRDDG